jgi:Bacterial SH3 domain.
MPAIERHYRIKRRERVRKRILFILILAIFLVDLCGCTGTTGPASGGGTTVATPPPTCESVAPYVALPSSRKVYVIKKNVNIREGAGESCNIISNATTGKSFMAVGKKGEWFHINLNNGQQGYIYEKLVSYKKPNTNTPITDPKVMSPPSSPQEGVNKPEIMSPEPEKPVQTQPGKGRITSATPVKLRTQPSTISKVIEEVSPGTEVTVIEKQGNWCKIKTQQSTGWVPAGALTIGGAINVL